MFSNLTHLQCTHMGSTDHHCLWKQGLLLPRLQVERAQQTKLNKMYVCTVHTAYIVHTVHRAHKVNKVRKVHIVHSTYVHTVCVLMEKFFNECG